MSKSNEYCLSHPVSKLVNKMESLTNKLKKRHNEICACEERVCKTTEYQAYQQGRQRELSFALSELEELRKQWNKTTE